MSRFVAAAVTAAALLLGTAACGETEDEKAARIAHEDLAGQWATLQRAGTVSVQFNGRIYSADSYRWGIWQGTSVVKFDAEATSDTQYDRIESKNGFLPTTSTTMQELRIADDHWYRSPDMRTSDDRPWVHAKSGDIFTVGDTFGDPNLGAVDLAMYLRFIREIPETAARGARTTELEDLAGAPREYHFFCQPRTTGCPRATFGTGLDRIATVIAIFNISAWVGEDGRLKRLTVNFEALKESGDSVTTKMQVGFTITGYGAPLAFAPPPTTEITADRQPTFAS